MAQLLAQVEAKQVEQQLESAGAEGRRRRRHRGRVPQQVRLRLR